MQSLRRTPFPSWNLIGSQIFRKEKHTHTHMFATTQNEQPETNTCPGMAGVLPCVLLAFVSSVLSSFSGSHIIIHLKRAPVVDSPGSSGLAFVLGEHVDIRSPVSRSVAPSLRGRVRGTVRAAFTGATRTTIRKARKPRPHPGRIKSHLHSKTLWGHPKKPFKKTT